MRTSIRNMDEARLAIQEEKATWFTDGMWRVVENKDGKDSLVSVTDEESELLTKAMIIEIKMRMVEFERPKVDEHSHSPAEIDAITELHTHAPLDIKFLFWLQDQRSPVLAGS